LSRVGQRFNAFSTQDIARHLTRWRHLAGAEGDLLKLAKLLLGLLLTLRGCACLYQGEELGLTDVDLPLEAIRDPWGLSMYPDYKGRDSCRTPVPWSARERNAGFTSGSPWLPLGPPHAEMAVDQQEGDPDSVLNAYGGFIKWRKQQAPLRWGRLSVLEAPPPLFAFERVWQGQRVLAVFNLSPGGAAWKPTGDWVELQGHGLPAATLLSGGLQFQGLDVFLGARASDQ
jgi:alpha-glucosidase